MNKNLYTRLLILNLFTSGHCTIAHIALAMALSYIMSNSIYVFSFFTGLYLMSMGIGALLAEKADFKSEGLVTLIVINGLLGVFLASPGITGVIIFNEFGRYLLRAHNIDILFVMFPLGMILTMLIGIVSGAEIPIFSKLIEKENWHPSKPIIGVLTSDYFGAFAGIILFTFILNPFAGLVNGILYAQIAALICINITFWSMDIPKKFLPALWGMNIYVALMFFFRFPFANFIDAISGF